MRLSKNEPEKVLRCFIEDLRVDFFEIFNIDE